MQTPARTVIAGISATVIGFLVFAALAAISFAAVDSWLALVPLGVLLGSVCVGWAAFQRIRGLPLVPDPTAARWRSSRVRCVIIGLYAITWAVGAPLSQTAATRSAVETCRRVAARLATESMGSEYPYIGTFVAIPILPLVILSYEEYQVAQLYGQGSWNLHLWYGPSVLSIPVMTVWVS